MVRCSQFGSQVCLQCRLQFHYLTVCSGSYVIDVTYRFCYYQLWIQVGTLNSICMIVFAWLLGYEYYIHYMSVQDTLCNLLGLPS